MIKKVKIVMTTSIIGTRLPEVNLVPMMDVVMTILTFFIIVSMTLTNATVVKEVSLPSTETKKSTENEPPEPLVVGVNKQGQLIIKEAPVGEAELGKQVVDYLTKNPKGAVVLKADKSLSYDKVIKAIAVLRDVGGDKVSLAVE
jgi:biopolymer transport protein ExbD